ncbi:MAG: phosphatase PAP2 family protein [Candidatus Electrothrix sp. GW3-4]|uniref:phosphatase PAP2 family protein n=1 Tax=Candidatus Electrothrix sp. GW3-4 TaxID=3126740 RepID=UPI0030D54643
MRTKRFIEPVAVTAALVLVTGLLWLTDADRYITSLVPRDHVIAAALPECDRAWPVGNLFPWDTLYKIAPIPAVLLACSAALVLLIGFFKAQFAPWRKKAVFILLLLALGPGLVINVLLKGQLGRPRPRQIVEFGGQYEFTQCWQPGTGGSNSSFPSGHAAIAFFLMAPWFVLHDKKKRWAEAFLMSGLLFGTLVGIARILQGGHFVSDILWAGGLLYLVGSLLGLFLGVYRDTSADH